MTITEATPRTPASRSRRGSGFTEAEQRAQKALHLLCTWGGFTDQEMAVTVGMTRESFRQRRTGVTRIRRGEEQPLADALHVGPECFAMTLDELVEWVHRDERGRDLLIAASRCNWLLTG